jgi:hypothetical protein
MSHLVTNLIYENNLILVYCPLKMHIQPVFFNLNRQIIIIIWSKQDFKPLKICLINHIINFTLVYNYSKHISWPKDIAIEV